MARGPRVDPLAEFMLPPVDPDGAMPLQRQLYDGLRQAILAGRVPPGARVPSTRAFCEVLGVSRNTVVAAFEQLRSEGYLEARVGSGTRVARTLPDELLTVRPRRGPAIRLRRALDELSQRGRELASTPPTMPGAAAARRPFQPGVPAIEQLPTAVLSRLFARRLESRDPELFTYGDPAGYPPLRAAIARHLRLARGVLCDPDQVIVVTGSQEALDLAARLLLDPGDLCWIEDPSYPGARAALQAAGGRMVPVPVDEEGLDVERGVVLAPDARVVYASPSHQYPTGATLSLPRRLALLRWAREHDAWILEDDYDSDFRYAGRPIPAMQGLDPDGRVVYVGTFSKVLSPGLRVGYLVVRPDLAGAFAAAQAATSRHAPALLQAVLADLIAEGHFTRHLRRMRQLYADRRAALVAALVAGGRLSVVASDTGMHLAAYLRDGARDVELSAHLARAGISAPPISPHRVAPGPHGFVLGFAGYTEGQLRAAARILHDVLDRRSPISA